MRQGSPDEGREEFEPTGEEGGGLGNSERGGGRRISGGLSFGSPKGSEKVSRRDRQGWWKGSVEISRWRVKRSWESESQS